MTKKQFIKKVNTIANSALLLHFVRAYSKSIVLEYCTPKTKHGNYSGFFFFSSLYSQSQRNLTWNLLLENGIYKNDFFPANTPSGIYSLQMATRSQSITKKCSDAQRSV